MHVEDDIDNESMDKTEPPTDQLTMSTDTRVPRDTHADARTVVRLPKSVPQALTVQNKRVKVKATQLKIC